MINEIDIRICTEIRGSFLAGNKEQNAKKYVKLQNEKKPYHYRNFVLVGI